MQERQLQMAAVRFPLHPGLLPDRRRSPSSLAQFVNQVGTPQMHRVLAEFLSQLIGHMVEVFYFFRLNRIVKKRVLDISIRLQVEQNNPGCPINLLGAVTGVKQSMNDIGDLQGTGAGPGELRLAADRIEIILLEKDNDSVWR